MELIKINKNEKGEQIVSARDLHEFLEVKSRFNDWIKNRVEKYDFIENVDFVAITKSLVTAQGNKYDEIDYLVKTGVAKELSMVENNEKGRQARKYFIECETKLNNISSESQQQRLYERSPQELLADNAIALNKMFNVLGLNIPKEIIVSSAITGTSNAIGYDFP
ncbi:MAG: antA/AntB antirepressor family protein, partial [Cetobacterium sp.]